MCRLRPFIFLPPSYPRTPLCGERYALTVHCKMLGRVLARLRPRLFDQCIADLRQHTPLFPPPKVIVDGLPRGEVVGELSPLAARFEDIEDSVDDFA